MPTNKQIHLASRPECGTVGEVVEGPEREKFCTSITLAAR